MKAVRALVALVVVIAVIAFFMPAGYWPYFIGKYHEMTGNTASALESYKNASNDVPENSGFVQAYTRTLNDLATERDDEELFTRAYRTTSDWLDDYEGSENEYLILIELSRAEWGRDRKQQARTAIDRAVDLAPTNYDALVYQGIIYRDTWTTERRIREGILIFEQAIDVKNHKSTYWAQLELAKAWWMIGDEVKSLNAIDQAMSQFPPRWVREEAERLRHDINSSGRSER